MNIWTWTYVISHQDIICKFKLDLPTTLESSISWLQFIANLVLWEKEHTSQYRLQTDPLPVVMDVQYERGPSPLDVKAATAIW